MTVKVESFAGEGEWQGLLAHFEFDVFHTFSFTEAYALELGGKPIIFAFFSEDNELIGALPAIERRISVSERWDLTTSYGYSGLLATRENYDSIFKFVKEELSLFYPKYVSLFCRSNPFLTAFGDGTDVIYIDLVKQNEDLLSSYRNGHRSEIKKVLRSVEVIEAQQSVENINRFHTIYSETMNRVAASSLHKFSHRFFVSLCNQSDFGIKLFFIRVGSKDVGACMFLWCGKIGHYFLSGSSQGYDKYVPGKLLVHKCNTAAKELGLSILSLGGGLGGTNDTLSQFKRGFSKTTVHYRTESVILDPVTYHELISSVNLDSSVNFFPAYRYHEN